MVRQLFRDFKAMNSKRQFVAVASQNQFFALVIAAFFSSCLRAPPAFTPASPGAVFADHHSAGQIQAMGGVTTDGAVGSPTGGLTGRVRVSRVVDLGIDGLYGASGYRKTWGGRISPRIYFLRENPVWRLALEPGPFGGVYESAKYSLSGNDVSEFHPGTPFGGFNVLVRAGAKLGTSFEFSLGGGPFLSVGAIEECEIYDGLSCNGRRTDSPNVGVQYYMGFAYTHPAGWTLGAQGNAVLAVAFYSPLWFNASLGGTLTVGYRFGYSAESE